MTHLGIYRVLDGSVHASTQLKGSHERRLQVGDVECDDGRVSHGAKCFPEGVIWWGRSALRMSSRYILGAARRSWGDRKDGRNRHAAQVKVKVWPLSDSPARKEVRASLTHLPLSTLWLRRHTPAQPTAR
jgi:hypothetical protein